MSFDRLVPRNAIDRRPWPSEAWRRREESTRALPHPIEPGVSAAPVSAPPRPPDGPEPDDRLPLATGALDETWPPETDPPPTGPDPSWDDGALI